MMNIDQYDNHVTNSPIGDITKAEPQKDDQELTSFHCYWENCRVDCGNFRQLVLHVGEHIDANDWSEK